jgi:hypothetical protein
MLRAAWHAQQRLNRVGNPLRQDLFLASMIVLFNRREQFQKKLPSLPEQKCHVQAFKLYLHG